MIQNIKENAGFWSTIAIALFSLIVFFNTRELGRVQTNIDKNRQTVVGLTIGCIKNIRSSMHNVKYKFMYHGQIYSGSKKFNMDILGDICEGYRFMIEFDSTNPRNNRILLDSLITTNPLYDGRFR